MIAGPTPLERRRDAAQATLDAVLNKPLVLGTTDCAKMCTAHVRRLGHKVSLIKAGSYKTALGARRALRRMGFDNLEQAMDGLGFARIAPAEALVADIMLLPGDDFGALTVYVGNSRVVGFHQDAEGGIVMQPLLFAAAWRVGPIEPDDGAS